MIYLLLNMCFSLLLDVLLFVFSQISESWVFSCPFILLFAFEMLQWPLLIIFTVLYEQRKFMFPIYALVIVCYMVALRYELQRFV